MSSTLTLLLEAEFGGGLRPSELDLRELRGGEPRSNSEASLSCERRGAIYED